MPNRKAAESRKPEITFWRKLWRVAALLFCFAVSALSLSRFMMVRMTHKPAAQTPATLATPTPTTLTKEYVYAGDRLVAIEEPVAGNTAAPTGFLATAQPTGQVSLKWATPVSGTVDHYEVERTENLAGASPYSFICAGSPCADPNAVTGKAYLYHVRAIFAGSGASAYSNQDLAVTAVFADDPLNPGGTRTVIRARHFTELFEAVNAVRTAVGLLPFNWTNPAPQSGTTVRASHYNDLRSALSEALVKLGLPVPQPARAGSGNAATYQPIQELCDLIR